MTFEQLAQEVAKDFNEVIREQGFGTFARMKKSYCWDAQDVKEEVEETISALASKRYNGGEFADFWMADDFSFVQIGFDDMSWCEFKKLLFKYLD